MNVIPEIVEKMKKLSKEERNVIACKDLGLDNNDDEIVSARQAQIDLGEEQEDRKALIKPKTEKVKEPKKTVKKKK